MPCCIAPTHYEHLRPASAWMPNMVSRETIRASKPILGKRPIWAGSPGEGPYAQTGWHTPIERGRAYLGS